MPASVSLSFLCLSQTFFAVLSIPASFISGTGFAFIPFWLKSFDDCNFRESLLWQIAGIVPTEGGFVYLYYISFTALKHTPTHFSLILALIFAFFMNCALKRGSIIYYCYSFPFALKSPLKGCWPLRSKNCCLLFWADNVASNFRLNYENICTYQSNLTTFAWHRNFQLFWGV